MNLRYVLRLLDQSALPVAGIFFLASIYFGWLFTPQLVADLARDAFSYDAPGVNYYLRLQWTFFLSGLCSIAGFFGLRALRTFLDDVRRHLPQLIALTLLMIGAVGAIYWIEESFYARYYANKTSFEPGRSEPRRVQPTAATPEPAGGVAGFADGQKDHTPKAQEPRTAKKSELLSETVKAFKDLNSYLLNWAILLVTSIAAFLVRELNILPRREGS